MNLNEFLEMFPNESQKTVIEIQCTCGKQRKIVREKAICNIKRNGTYVCRACKMTGHTHTQETKDKISIRHKGKSVSDVSKKKMSTSKKALYKTEAGRVLRRKLSKYTALQNATVKLDKSKRRGIFHSKKNNKMMSYHSSYELRLCWMLEEDSSVISYETQIYYEVEDRSRCLDFLVVYQDSQRAIEVKPSKRLTEQVHIAQINDSRTNAEANGWLFAVFSEEELGMSSSRDITKWADAFRLSMGEENLDEYRRFRSRLRAIKHYRKVIAENKVVVWCDYCSCEHTPLKLTYDKNIARNGTYVCEAKGGSIGGSKPKPKKSNPYAVEGKKECTECHEVKIFDDFGSDKSRADGYSNRCKVCRAKKSKKAYKEGKKNTLLG